MCNAGRSVTGTYHPETNEYNTIRFAAIIAAEKRIISVGNAAMRDSPYICTMRLTYVFSDLLAVCSPMPFRVLQFILSTIIETVCYILNI